MLLKVAPLSEMQQTKPNLGVPPESPHKSPLIHRLKGATILRYCRWNRLLKVAPLGEMR
jgi:hypothetical protein